MASKSKKILLVAMVALILTAAVGGTVAWLTTSTGPIENIFDPSKVTCKINETFDGSTKSNVSVKNTSDIPAYIRVALVAAWQDASENVAGGKGSWEPSFNPGADWIKRSDGYYYYTKAVAAGEDTGVLIDSITLATDGDFKQTLTICAEAIQANPATAVQDAWGVTVTDGIISK